jgi:hypothetical protein
MKPYKALLSRIVDKNKSNRQKDVGRLRKPGQRLYANFQKTNRKRERGKG